MDEPQKTLQVKGDTKDYQLYNSNYMKFLENRKLQSQKADQWIQGHAVKAGNGD